MFLLDLHSFKEYLGLNKARIYNLEQRKKPAELVRKDLISAMKLPDHENLNREHYFRILDPWREEWEKGVQVPVNPDALPQPVTKPFDRSQPLAQQQSCDEFTIRQLDYLTTKNLAKVPFKLPKKLIEVSDYSALPCEDNLQNVFFSKSIRKTILNHRPHLLHATSWTCKTYAGSTRLTYPI